MLAILPAVSVAVWGLAFKPRTDDIREAPALVLIDLLLDAGAIVQVFDPVAADNVREIYGDRIVFCDDQYDALENADALAIVTEWSDFRNPDFAKMKSLLAAPVVFDGRNLYSPEQMSAAGFQYDGIGLLTGARREQNQPTKAATTPETGELAATAAGS